MNSWVDAKDEASQDDASAPNLLPPTVIPGDKGQLPVDTRRVLVQLLRGPSIDVRRHTKLWPILLKDEEVVASRLHDIFLDLVIDREQGVAFTRQMSFEQLDIPILLRKAPLTFIESVLVLYLRQRLTQSDAQGDRAVVSNQEMLEHMSVFERQPNPDHARFERQSLNAIEKVKTLSLLHKLQGSDERYEVSPTLKLLFSAEDIQELTKVYVSAMASTAEADTTDDSVKADVVDRE
jgi:hypothetical protein